MKMVFDASALISVSQTCLVNILPGLKEKMNAEFIIPSEVFREAVERPIEVRRFELNAVRLKKVVGQGCFSVVSAKDKDLVAEIDGLANHCFFVKGRPVRLLQLGEIEALCLVKELGAGALAIDERTARMLVENPRQLGKIMEARRGNPVRIDSESVSRIKRMFSGLAFARSVELVSLAYEFGLLDQELPKGKQSLEAALFAVKYSGCAVSSREINSFLRGL